MNTQSDQLNLGWLPASGVQLRKAGVQFDAVRVDDGEWGRRLADRLAELTGGDPGPVIEVASGRRCVYFLVPAGSTDHLPWPAEVTRLTAVPARVSYIPIPALDDMTWPLAWRYRPTAHGRFVHTRLLRTALHSPE
ncbi:hypothetical protein ABT404_14780 [Streptomyces hyaluromycini]|uniref:DNA primase/polymerase bifunctional N-terminal domain-containing protein n=1 Tax=Streptomyces hyaluromycini TaxID=1377993 RepID=A0ABV1WVC3_9ACTN